jgi:hypothetical protein
MRFNECSLSTINQSLSTFLGKALHSLRAVVLAGQHDGAAYHCRLTSLPINQQSTADHQLAPRAASAGFTGWPTGWAAGWAAGPRRPPLNATLKPK